MTTHAVRVFQPPRNSENTCARIVKLVTTFWKAATVNYTINQIKYKKKKLHQRPQICPELSSECSGSK